MNKQRLWASLVIVTIVAASGLVVAQTMIIPNAATGGGGDPACELTGGADCAMNGSPVDVTSADATDLVLQAGTTGNLELSTTFGRVAAVVRNAAGTASGLFVAPTATTTLPAKLGFGIGGGAMLSCGAGNSCVQLRGSGYQQIYLQSESGGDRRNVIGFDNQAATAGRRAFHIEQTNTALEVSNYSNAAYTRNLIALSIKDTGPVQFFQREQTTITAPVACAAGMQGATFYADDTDDGARGAFCFCTSTDGASFAWVRMDNPTAACFGL